MATPVERIANRDPATRRFPAWLSLRFVGVSVMWGLLAAFYFFLQPPAAGAGLLPWFYLAIAVIWVFEVWDLSARSVEIGGGRLRVQYGVHMKTLPLDELVAVDAILHASVPLVKRGPRDYEIRFKRSRGRPWALVNIQPGAAERILSSLNRLHKPIMVYTWP